MRAIDTNVVIRFLTADDARDYKAARAVIEAGGVYVPLAVFLESEWVLRSAYGLSRVEIADGLAGLAGLPPVSVEEPAMLAMALGWMRDGMDFADALHLAKAKDCTSFLTFDRKLAKLAKKRSALPVELL